MKKAAKLIKERRLDISNLKVVGFDEADTFFKSETDMDDLTKFNETLNTTLKGDHPEQPCRAQKIFFSATYTDEAMLQVEKIVGAHPASNFIK